MFSVSSLPQIAPADLSYFYVSPFGFYFFFFKHYQTQIFLGTEEGEGGRVEVWCDYHFEKDFAEGAGSSLVYCLVKSYYSAKGRDRVCGFCLFESFSRVYPDSHP